ncbi:MAG: UbiA family prenyltransferase [Deltaproteobacteria bacterium]
MHGSEIEVCRSPLRRGAIWVQALRLYSLSASVVPVVLGAILEWPRRDASGTWLWCPALLGAVSLHLGANLTNDLGDFRSGADRLGSSEGSGVLPRGLLTEAQVGRAARVFFGFGVACGLPVALYRGWPVWWIGALGLFGGWGYTAGPRYKYLGLGDLGVFVLMGPSMALGGALAVSPQLDPRVVWASIPVGLLVVAILHVNNLRDREADAEAKITTVALVLGRAGSLVYLAALFLGAGLALVVVCAEGALPKGALVALVALSLAVSVFWVAASARTADSFRSGKLVEKTAGIHLLFGLLVVIGTLASRLHP